MTLTPEQALARAHNQSLHGPRFPVGMCKRKTRELYGVPSDGSGSAAEAWTRTRHRLRVDAGSAPAGALIWWTGGHDGNGHVAIKDTAAGYCWSVDFRRPGYFDRVLIAQIGAGWAALRFAGVSLDIDGVQVVPDPPHPTPNLDVALDGLRKARDARHRGTPGRKAVRAVIQSVKALRAKARR